MENSMKTRILIAVLVGIVVTLTVALIVVVSLQNHDVVVSVAPILSLELVEDPVLDGESGSYRFTVQAVVAGHPQPSLVFNRDESLGKAGENRAIVLLKPGETFVLVATATSPLGEVTASLELTAEPDGNGDIPPPPVANRPPNATKVDSDNEIYFVGCEYELKAVASDPDGDQLKYHWTASGGTFANSKVRTVKWKAPSTPGEYTVTVKVTDGRGGEAEISRTFNVIKLFIP